MSLLAGLLAAAGLAAQGIVSPPANASAEGNAASDVPFGNAQSRRYLQLHGISPNAPATFRGLSWRQNAGAGTFTGTRTLDAEFALAPCVRPDIVRFAFQPNFTRPKTVVVARRTVNFGPQGAASNPGPSLFQGMSVVFDQTFAWDGFGSLAWEATVFGGSGAGLFADADADRSPRNEGAHAILGTGCTVTGNTDAMRLDAAAPALAFGTFYALLVRHAPVNTDVLLTLGVRDPDFPLPGLCTNLRTDLMVTLPLGTTDRTGAFIPSGSQVFFVQRNLAGATLHAQVFALDTRSTAAIPLAASNGVATTFAAPDPTTPFVSRIYSEGDPAAVVAPFRSDSIGFGLVTRFDT